MTIMPLVCALGMLFPCCAEKDYRTESVVYARPDGEPLRATLYTPARDHDALRPAVVLIHGGAWLTGSRRQLFWYGRRLAEHGYVALSISYRTMPGAPFPAQVHDAKAAVRWLRTHAEALRVDPERIGALGTSAGGHMALMLAFTRPEDGLEGSENLGPSSAVQAAVSFYGPTDLAHFEEEKRRWPSGAFWRPYVRAYVGEKAHQGRDPLSAASPIAYAHEEAPPVLLVHGMRDRLVPARQAESLFSRLQEKGTRATLVRIPRHRHAFDHIHPSVRRDLFPRVLEFLDAHLGSD